MGLLAKLSPKQADKDILVYQAPANTLAVFNINVLNRAASPVNVSLAIKTPDDLSVESVNVVNSGTGLTAIPSVTVTGTNTTEASVSIRTLVLTGANIAVAGEGYAVNDTITLSIPGAVQEQAAVLKVESVSGTGAITSVSILNGGNFTAVGTSGSIGSTTSTAGTGASFTSLVYGVGEVVVNTPGHGYSAAPALSVSSGSGISLTASVKHLVEDDDYFEYDVLLEPGEILERTGISLENQQLLFVKTNVQDAINIHLWGFKKLA